VHISNSLFLRIFQVINQAIFEASKTPDKNTFVKIMEEKVKPAMPHAYAHFAKVDPQLWTHHASSQTTRVGDQSTTNLVESNIQWLSEEVSIWVCVIPPALRTTAVAWTDSMTCWLHIFSGLMFFGLASFDLFPLLFSSVRNWHKILSCRIELSRAVVNGYTSHMVHMAIALKVNFHLPTVR